MSLTHFDNRIGRKMQMPGTMSLDSLPSSNAYLQQRVDVRVSRLSPGPRSRLDSIRDMFSAPRAHWVPINSTKAPQSSWRCGRKQ
jgi:hypothetical protein